MAHIKFLTHAIYANFVCYLFRDNSWVFVLDMPPKPFKTYSSVQDVLNDVLNSEFEVLSDSEYGEISSEEEDKAEAREVIEYRPYDFKNRWGFFSLFIIFRNVWKLVERKYL